MEEELSGFYEMSAKFLKIREYLALVGNMDETPVFLDMVPNKSFAKKGAKSVIVRTSACEKKRVAVPFIATGGDISPPMIIFPGKNDGTSKGLTVPDNLCIVTQEKAWRNERLMMV